MKINIIKGDIASIKADAIVNAANTSLLGGGGVDGAIHKKGGAQILNECIVIRNKQGGCKTGEAVITSGGNLPAKFVIHIVGPVWNNGKSNEVNLLMSCYTNALKLAQQNNLQSIAFANISTGIYKFPKDKTVEIAFDAVRNFIKTEINNTIKEISFVCFDEENYQLYKNKPAIFTTLYRPVNQAELDLIEITAWKKFPPRLPEQPIFYPVTNEAYAIQIAKDWNVPAYGIGHVVEFDVSNHFLCNYNIENVGGEIHNEYWIPAKDVEIMNENILGSIRLTKTFKNE
jgi:O-acetyl-ADP-ribose deacetylase